MLILLARTEGVLVAAIWMAKEWIGFSRHRERAAIGRFAARCLLVVLTIVLFYGWRYSYYGTILPHSLAMKKIVSYYKPDPAKILHYWLAYASMVTCMTFAGITMKPFKNTPGNLSSFMCA